jgi:hypothetical protein
MLWSIYVFGGSTESLYCVSNPPIHPSQTPKKLFFTFSKFMVYIESVIEYNFFIYQPVH